MEARRLPPAEEVVRSHDADSLFVGRAMRRVDYDFGSE
jgi:hypothetical protein